MELSSRSPLRAGSIRPAGGLGKSELIKKNVERLSTLRRGEEMGGKGKLSQRNRQIKRVRPPIYSF